MAGLVPSICVSLHLRFLEQSYFREFIVVETNLCYLMMIICFHAPDHKCQEITKSLCLFFSLTALSLSLQGIGTQWEPGRQVHTLE